ncbi:MAG: archaemetzincin family Zn-dependent metalloprotease [Fibrobacter sp.]|nr:archaemetzincin family Zn-dependent metalloprotease [Fibrobacter sp.]
MAIGINKEKVILFPMGPVSDELLEWLLNMLPETAGVKGVKEKQTKIPFGAYNRKREQYLGDALLEYIREMDHYMKGTLIGLINADCYAEGHNYIFGEAVLKGYQAIVALPRLRQSFYGLSENPDLFRERVLKEILHELGHTWGFTHCPDPLCAMHFANSLSDIDVKNTHYCELHS